ncbi:uncharacterized protein ALTATR162_LOCUS6595 [Alternaria atra]|uniref:Uncharacterized protein n=1 Tax=Alternaria atra TaxID=119953 RepID=A0A8J2I360_9PLEO|nr:uncharacterized protein ALTATR162_LOCUS6595 [Alternaria atra]CAG5164010.1 unnamed protein product [Alternaria atra]
MLYSAQLGGATRKQNALPFTTSIQSCKSQNRSRTATQTHSSFTPPVPYTLKISKKRELYRPLLESNEPFSQTLQNQDELARPQIHARFHEHPGYTVTSSQCLQPLDQETYLGMF